MDCDRRSEWILSRGFVYLVPGFISPLELVEYSANGILQITMITAAACCGAAVVGRGE